MDWYGDHVWTEYYSPAQKRWVHVDSCENAVDNPLMYECGWNKPIMYIFALARDHVADVTMRYSCDHRGVISRRAEKFNGSWLYDTFQSLNNHLSVIVCSRNSLMCLFGLNLFLNCPLRLCSLFSRPTSPLRRNSSSISCSWAISSNCSPNLPDPLRWQSVARPDLSRGLRPGAKARGRPVPSTSSNRLGKSWPPGNCT